MPAWLRPNTADRSGRILTRVYDVTRASQSVNWGGFASLTLELDNTDVALNYLYTRDVKDTAVLATNTRGRDFYLDPAFDGNGDGSDFPEGSTPILMFAVRAFRGVDVQRTVHPDPATVGDPPAHRLATRLARSSVADAELTSVLLLLLPLPTRQTPGDWPDLA